jgi:hypothetical protein
MLSLVGLPRLAVSRASRQSLRSFSTPSSPEALFLWLGGEGDNDKASDQASTPLLLPKLKIPCTSTVSAPDDIRDQVNEFYEKSHFVGGMGEEDPGVWFAACHGNGNGNGKGDALDYAELVQEGIFITKQERHGVPFGLYTSGLVTPSIPLSELGLSTLQVSLYCGSPPDYAKVTGRDAKAFGQLCGFIVDAVEQGVTVEVGVLEAYAGSARDLALSLGAQQVHVYPTPEPSK